MVRYSAEFFESGAKGSIPSARIVLPFLQEMYPFQSLVDVGCGNGPWASVAMELGVSVVEGIDGDYVPRDALLIPADSFKPQDLRVQVKRDHTFDVALCIEVAEHLPVARAASLVSDLCALAPVVLFSAAIPGQGGTGHVNEQWQSYWVELFQREGYHAIDSVRRNLWETEGLAAIYKQNLLIMCSEDALAGNEMLRTALLNTDPRMWRVVHPDVYNDAKIILYAEDVAVRRVLTALPRSIIGAIKRRIR